jgi:hypothetical protein
MQITVLGVTRPLGAHAAKKALDHGHTVCVLVRHGENSIPASVRLHENAGTALQVFEGDATDEGMLKEATYKSDAVLNFVGGRYNLKTTVVSDSTQVPPPPFHASGGRADSGPEIGRDFTSYGQARGHFPDWDWSKSTIPECHPAVYFTRLDYGGIGEG